MQTKQEQEAKAFAEANESRIAAIRGRLMDAGAAFMRTSIASQLPAMVARKANECLEKHDPAMFGSWLRQAPVGSPGTQEGGMYWSLVDACIFFGDAIGTLGVPVCDASCFKLFYVLQQVARLHSACNQHLNLVLPLSDLFDPCV